jgi:hypothetical protein
MLTEHRWQSHQPGKTMAIQRNPDFIVGGAAAQAEGTPVPALPEEYRARLLSLRRRHNWDGEGAKAVTAGACRAALRFIEVARCRQPDLPLPRPAPSVLGAVSLYWKHGNKHLVASLASNDPASVSLHWEGSGGRFENRTLPLDLAIDDVLAFHSQ